MRGAAILVGLIALAVQGFTTANAWLQNISAGVMIAGLFAAIDVAAFGLLFIASHKTSSDKDRAVCFLTLATIAPIIVVTLGQAINTADQSNREEFNKQYIESTTLLASSALDDASLSSSEASRWTDESNGSTQRKSQYTRQALAHSDQSKAARSQAAALLDKAMSASQQKTRREIGLSVLGKYQHLYVYYVALVATLLASVLSFYSMRFMSESDSKTVKPSKPKSPHKPRPTGGGGGSKTKTETKTTTLKNAPKLELVKTDSKLELSRKWALNTSDKINVKNLMDHLKRNKEGVSNEKARGYLIEMCKGGDKILQRTSTAKNAGFIRIKKVRVV